MSRTDRPPYPPNWRELVALVRARSGDRCDGNPHVIRSRHLGRCNAPNGEQIIRRPDKPWIWDRHPACSLCVGGHAEAGDDRKPIVVKLTTAHLKPADSGDHSLENLRHLCQRCHLRLDLEHHQANAAATRRRKLQNGELFP